jgi:hypothetical protein
MVLTTVKGVLKANRRMTLSQIVAETGGDRKTVAAALEYFVQRGNVHREVESASGVTCGTACKSCPIAGACLGGSTMTGLEVFVWSETNRGGIL